MRTTPLVPPDRRLFFYALLTGDFPAFNFRMNPAADAETREEGFTSRAQLYLRLSLGALDLGLGPKAAGQLLKESAFCSKLSVDSDPSLLPIQALEALFAFQAVIAEEPTKAFARSLAARSLPKRGSEAASPQVHALVAALSHSILGARKEVEATLAAVTKLGPLRSSRKSGKAWFEGMRQLARACLLGSPGDLSALCEEVAGQAQAYFGGDFEDQLFEGCFGTMTLAFLARARDRGFDVTGPDPHPSLPLEVLRLPRGSLPTHPWHLWPAPDARLVKAVKAALRTERTGAQPPAKRPTTGKMGRAGGARKASRAKAR